MKNAGETIEEFSKRMRIYGESSKDKAIIEDNLANGNIVWVNSYTLSKTGYTLDQLCHMTVYDILPQRWHSELSERMAGKRGKYFVFPFKTADNNVAWWFCEDMYEEYPQHWAHGKYMTTTSIEGHEFEVMALVADSANKTGEILYQYDDLNKWVRSEIQRLDLSDNSIRLELSQINRRLGNAISAAQDAANHSIQSNQRLIGIEAEFKNLNKGMDKRFEDITAEILSLLSGDKAAEKRIKDFDVKVDEIVKIYERRINDFEDEIKVATRLATRSIELQASQAGKTISKKVAFPISVISSLAIIVAQLLQHPEIFVKMMDYIHHLLGT